MSYTVKHGTENDGPKHTAFATKAEARTFAESVGGEVLTPPAKAKVEKPAPKPATAHTSAGSNA